MTYKRDPRVDEYIARLPEWQRDICHELRELIHAADPELVETIKRTVQPYFVLQGNLCALLAAKDHVNLFLYDGESSQTRTGSSPVNTPTRPPGRSRSGKATGSTVAPSPRCLSRSSRTTALAAGANSRRGKTATSSSPTHHPQASMQTWFGEAASIGRAREYVNGQFAGLSGGGG